MCQIWCSHRPNFREEQSNEDYDDWYRPGKTILQGSEVDQLALIKLCAQCKRHLKAKLLKRSDA